MNATKTLLITGASRGIGAALAVKAAKAGWRVAISYVSNSDAAGNVVSAIEAAGGEAFAVKGDVGSEADILAIFAAVDERFGRLDGFVNNAGVIDVAASVSEMSAERLERMFRINLIGSFLCAREAVKRMSTRYGGKGGVIVNVSSAAARVSSPDQYVDYAASKAAVDNLTKGLSLEVAEDGVRVNSIRPGIIETEIHASGGEPDRPERLRQIVPMKRPGKAEEVADGILYLLSDQSSYVTGSVLEMTGGR